MYEKLGLILLVLIGWWWVRPDTGWVTYDPEVHSLRPPVQSGGISTRPFQHMDYTVTPKAYFDIEARVLSRCQYHMGREVKLAPVDLALGWGQMADDRVIKRLRISQGNRWYTYRYKLPPPIPQKDIIAQSACKEKLKSALFKGEKCSASNLTF